MDKVEFNSVIEKKGMDWLVADLIEWVDWISFAKACEDTNRACGRR